MKTNYSKIKEKGKEVLDKVSNKRYGIRFRNNLAKSPIYAATNTIGTAMAMGSASSDKQSIQDYLVNGVKGVYNIPKQFIQKYQDGKTVMENTPEVVKAGKKAGEDLEGIVSSSKEILKNPVENSKKFYENYGEFQKSGENFVDVLNQKEKMIENYATDRAGDLTELVQNMTNNFSEDFSTVATVTGLFMAAGLASGYYLSRNVNKIPGLNKIAGKNKTTKSEDAIHLGKKGAEYLTGLASIASISYALAKESTYSKFKNISESFNTNYSQLKENTQNLSETMKNYFSSKSEQFSDNLERGVERVKSLFTGDEPEKVNQGKEYMNIDSIVEAGEKTAKEGYQTFRNLEEMSTITDEKSFSEAYKHFLNNSIEGLTKGIEKGGDIADKISNNENTKEASDFVQNLPEELSTAMMNLGTNIAQYPAETAALVGTAYVASKAITSVPYFTANKIHDKKYYKKQKNS